MSHELAVAVFSAGVLGGAYFSSRMEALEIHQRNIEARYQELPHPFLVSVRCLGLGVLLLLLFGTKDLVLDLKMAMYGALLFGTPHRVVLNLTRRYKYRLDNKTITWYHLRMRGYDTLVKGVRAPWNFLLLCASELALAYLIIHQTLST